MNALILEPTELGFVPDGAKASVALVRETDLDSILEEIQIRESTITPVMEEILNFRPSSHWGINE
jgi:hypothetical protein